MLSDMYMRNVEENKYTYVRLDNALMSFLSGPILSKRLW